jgi:hypothetical protein
MLRTCYPLLAICVLTLAGSARAIGAQAKTVSSPSSGASAPGPTRQAVLIAQPDPLHQQGQNVTISLLTMGNGEQVWELFGHNALWIHDNRHESRHRLQLGRVQLPSRALHPAFPSGKDALLDGR